MILDFFFLNLSTITCQALCQVPYKHYLVYYSEQLCKGGQLPCYFYPCFIGEETEFQRGWLSSARTNRDLNPHLTSSLVLSHRNII